jgi:hypothetical protein
MPFLSLDASFRRKCYEARTQFIRLRIAGPVVIHSADHGRRDASGAIVERTGFTDDSGRRIDYAGLSESVDDSVKLISLLRDVETTSLRAGMREDHRYRMGGILVQNYIEGELTQYVKEADGVGEWRSIRGSILRWDIWA